MSLHITILLTFCVVIHLDHTFCEENMHISTFKLTFFSMRPKIHINGSLILSSKIVTFWGATRGIGFKVNED